MKKLIFDDFQSRAGRKFIVEEVVEQDQQSMQQQPDQQPNMTQPTEPELPPQRQSAQPPAPQRPAIENFSLLRPEVKLAPREFQVSDFFDLNSPLAAGDTEPKTEFNFLLGKVLALIKDVTFAHTVAFFWANREKGQLVAETYVSDSKAFMKSRRLAFGHDLVSKVAENGKPELITDVNPLSEAEMLPYYNVSAGIKSFAGVPVYFAAGNAPAAPSQPVAVIVLDSVVEGTFGQETLLLLGQFTKLVSGLIKSYTQKYDLLLDAEVLSSLQRMQQRMKEDFSSSNITALLAEECCKLLNLDFLSIVLYDDRKRSWMIKKVVNRAHEPYVAPEQQIDFPRSIAGQTIRNNMRAIAEQAVSAGVPRFHHDEKIGTNGPFLSLPISSLNKCYGSLNLERREKFFFTQQDADILAYLTSSAAKALEVLNMNDVINEYVIIDDITGVYSRKFFLQRMDEELARADDGGIELSFLLVVVDHAKDIVQRFGQEGFDRVMNSLAKAIRGSVRSYDLVGRLDSDRFGIVLINTAANDAYLWSEKIRKNVASHVIDIDGKSFSMTISAGVTGALEGSKRQELFDNAGSVLGKATAAGGNSVRVF